jgi:ATP-binding cassette subfamily B protein
MNNASHGNIVFSQLRALLAPQRKMLVITTVCVLLGAALEILPPLIVQNAIDVHVRAQTENGNGLLALGIAYVLVIGAAQGLGFGANYGTTLAAQHTLRVLRVRLFAQLQRMPTHYFDVTPLGDLISRCTADVDTIDTLFSSGVANLLTDVVRLIVVVIAMIALSPALTVISALGILPVLWLTRVFQKRTRDAERDNRRAVGLLNSHLQETLSGVEVIRAFGISRFFQARFQTALQATLNAYLRATRYSAVYTPFMVIFAACIVGVLLWAGSVLKVSETWGISIGTLGAFVLLFRRFFTPIASLGEEWQTVQGALAGAERVFQILMLPVEPPTTQTQRVLQTPQTLGTTLIELDHVTFGYAPDAPVLKDVSLRVRAGEQVALVGRTGAGKSSLVHLVGGLYTPWTGQVRLCGADPRTLTDAQRQSLLGVVPQTLQLFSGTIYENMVFGNPTITLADVEETARQIGAHSFIESLPQGYKTPLVSGSTGVGGQLSTGQRQLLALVRALVRRPAVLLLDEATAAIDNTSDATFRASLRTGVAVSQWAVLIVAHRLSTARAADRVIVLEEGRVIEEGTPEMLIQQGGRFAALLELEAAGWDWQRTNVRSNR